MEHRSSKDSSFLSTVKEWIGQNKEVLMLFRYSRGAGSKSFEFFDSFPTFEQRLLSLPPQTSIIVFGTPQLPIRGKVDKKFIDNALSLIPNGAEFLIYDPQLTEYGKSSWHSYEAGETNDELVEALKEKNGQLVFLGLYPPWLEDNEKVISAIVPNETGKIVAGIY